MYKLTKYIATDQMSDLITENYLILNVISRFAMSLGVGQKTIEQCCKENSVDTETFLQIVNLAADISNEQPTVSNLHLPSLLLFLVNSHKYFVDFRLPIIREKLEMALQEQTPVIIKSIIDYFDQYLFEVKKHFDYEERKVFPYITSLIDNKKNPQYSISIFSRQHDHIEMKLMELKNIIIQYYNLKTSYELNDVLLNIFATADDMRLHNEIENRLLVPTIAEIESNLL
jgi:regulator of cell morphogenesis and NO signaling